MKGRLAGKADMGQVSAAVKAALTAEGVEFDGVKVDNLMFDLEARIVRSQILAGEPRIDDMPVNETKH